MNQVERDVEVFGEFDRPFRLEKIHLKGVQAFVPLMPVEARLVAHAAEEFMPLFQQHGNQASANVTVGSGDKNFHSADTLAYSAIPATAG